MSYVELYRTTAEGQELVGRVTFTNNVVGYESIPRKFVDELKRGVNVCDMILSPKDGLKFLEALPTAYSGSYLRAAYFP